MCILGSLSLGFLLAVSFAAYEDDRVTSLPYFDSKFDKLNFGVYSGYIESYTGYHFYFFTESSGDASTDPLVLWLVCSICSNKNKKKYILKPHNLL